MAPPIRNTGSRSAARRAHMAGTGRHGLFCDIRQHDSCDEALREGTENVSRSDGQQQDLDTG